MRDEDELLRQAVVELAQWLDRWRDTEAIEQLADPVRQVWLDYVAANFEIPRRRDQGQRLAEVIPLTADEAPVTNRVAPSTAEEARDSEFSELYAGAP
jgi:hypothetical protein